MYIQWCITLMFILSLNELHADSVSVWGKHQPSLVKLNCAQHLKRDCTPRVTPQMFLDRLPCCSLYLPRPVSACVLVKLWIHPSNGAFEGHYTASLKSSNPELLSPRHPSVKITAHTNPTRLVTVTVGLSQPKSSEFTDAKTAIR